MNLDQFCSVLESNKYQYMVMYISACSFNKKFVKKTKENYDSVIRHLVSCFEETLRLSNEKFNKEQIIILLDLKDVKMKHLEMRFMKEVIHLFEHQYPDRLKYCIIINHSFIIKILYKIIYPLIDKDTRKKFVWEKNGRLQKVKLDDDCSS